MKRAANPTAHYNLAVAYRRGEGAPAMPTEFAIHRKMTEQNAAQPDASQENPTRRKGRADVFVPRHPFFMGNDSLNLSRVSCLGLRPMDCSRRQFFRQWLAV